MIYNPNPKIWWYIEYMEFRGGRFIDPRELYLKSSCKQNQQPCNLIWRLPWILRKFTLYF